MNNTLVTSVSGSAKAISRFAALLVVLALSLVISATADDLPTQLQITRKKGLYSSPYLLDISINVHDEKNEPVRLNPSEFFSVICKEINDPSMFSEPFNPFGGDLPSAIDWLANNPNIPPISVSETGFRLLTGKKQLKGFVVLDYTRSMLDPSLDGHTNGNLKSDAAEAMENAAKAFLSTLPRDAQIGLYEFHRGDVSFPPQRIANLMRDKTYLTNAIEQIWTNVVWTSGSSRCWDALHMALSEFPTEAPADDQRFLVFLSDGKDESSIHKTNDVIALAQTNGVSIYCVGYGHELTQAPLMNITAQTEGGYYAATNTTNIVQLFQKISDELQSPYILRWATLQRTNSFIPLFQLSLTNANSVIWANATNATYSPVSFAGNELEGHLRFDASLEPTNAASLILRASYIPRGVTRLRVNFSTIHPFSVDQIVFGDGGVCPTNWTFTVHQTNGSGYFELSSPTPEDVFSDLPFATFGKLVEFRIEGVRDLTNCFYELSVDNSLYRQAGGPSITIDNSHDVSGVVTNPPPGTPHFPTELHITRNKGLYSSPYLLDININVHDENDHPVRLNPADFGVTCKEVDPQIFVNLMTNKPDWYIWTAINHVANDTKIAPISPSETGFRLVTGKKQLKGFLVLDYTRSLLDPVLNGDTDGDLKSDAVEAMEAAAKMFLSSLPRDAQIGLYEFHRGDAGFPPQKIANLMRDKAYLTNEIDQIWDGVVWTSGASLCWDTLHMALSEFPQENPADDQRFLVFLSDGKDESSIHSITNVIALAQTNGVSIYCVGYGNELAQEPLANITTQTGGGYYPAAKTSDFVDLFKLISDELQAPYILRWATLQRTNSFIPLFQLSLSNTYSMVVTNTTNILYLPPLHPGNELQGHLQFDTSLEPGNIASLILRASYIPRGVTRLRVNVSTLYPITVEQIAFEDGGICPTNWTFTFHQTDGIGYFELSSPTPDDVFTDLPFATLGKLVEFRIQGVTNLIDCFYGLSVDNSLYRQPGGPSLVIDNSYAVSVVSTTPPHGTPVEWLNRYGFTNNFALAEITDHDGDGSLTWQEYLAGTNPTNATSVFRLIGATRAQDGWHITFNTESNLVYHLDSSDMFSTWAVLAANIIGDGRPRTVVDPVLGTQRFYRAVLGGSTNPPSTNQPPKLGVVPGGLFTMGDVFNQDPRGEAQTNAVYVNAFFMDQYEVTKEFWDSVMAWALENGYSFDNIGYSKTANHPVHTLNWYDAVKWCNARSQRDGLTPCYYENGLGILFKTGRTLPFVNWDANGYRLPTEAEWEKAARGGATGHRFPWADSDNITHAQANYYSSTDSFYDTSSTRGFNPTFTDGVWPFTSPVGYFAPNGYGLYDVAGNVWEWCWDWYGSYPSGGATDPHGPSTGNYRVRRGGSWHESAAICQTAKRSFLTPEASYDYVGLRCVRAATQ